MSSEDALLTRVLAAIDAANAEDPHRLWVRGELRHKELAHAQLASEWVGVLVSEPSPALQLAARAHHVRRWEIPRTSYPQGRAGYLHWRRVLKRHHADTARAILERFPLDAPLIERVESLISRRALGRDSETQVLEDAICLVFIETQLADFAAGRDPARVTRVLEKTARKMSAQGRACILGLPLAAATRGLLRDALACERAPSLRHV